MTWERVMLAESVSERLTMNWAPNPKDTVSS